MKNLSTGLLLIAVASSVAAASHPSEQWVGSWASSQMSAEQNSAAPSDLIRGGTLRRIVHLSAGGPRIRVRVSNAFGTAPLHLIALHVAHAPSPAASRIDPATDVTVTFDHRADVFIPAGAEYTSDPIDYEAAPLSDLAVTMQLEAPPERQTGHPGSGATSYLGTGATASAAEMPAGAQSIEHWYFLSGVDVSGSSDAAAVVTLGATITPFVGSGFYHPDAANESDRTQVNDWIRAPGHFDAVVDFDKTIADPAHPDHMLGDYDSGDHLHPSAAGYKAMADAIPLTFFLK